jgi:hypothetical protein
MIIEILKGKISELLKVVLENYMSDIRIEEYNKLINACFSISDFVVANEIGDYVDFHDTKNLSAIYILRQIGELVDSGNFEHELDCFKHCSDIGGRLREALIISKSFLTTKEGTMEILKNGSLMSAVNFSRIKPTPQLAASNCHSRQCTAVWWQLNDAQPDWRADEHSHPYLPA